MSETPTILEQWRAIAYDQQADKNRLQRFWATYFNIEKGIYEANIGLTPNNNGETIGMLFAGKPTSEVERENKGAIMFIPLITIIMTIIASLISMAPAKNLVDAIKKEEKFLDEIAKGNLNTEIDPSIIKRNDELGEMGRFSRSVQKFIRDMIENKVINPEELMTFLTGMVTY